MKTISRRLNVPGFEIREQHYVPGYRATWHSHDEAEFCLVFDGRMTEEIHCGTRLLATIARGSFKPRGLRHRVDVSGQAAECIVISVSPERLQDQEPLGRALGRPFLLDESHLHRLRAAMKSELRADDDFSGVALESLALELLLLAARDRGRRASSDVPRWLLRVRDRLHDEAFGHYSLTELAATAGVKPTTLAQAFRRHFHTTVGGYIRELRMRNAEELLRKGTLSIAEVALSCGFYDQSHFTRTFHRSVGMTPGRYAARFRSR